MKSTKSQALDVKETPGTVFSPLTEAPEDQAKYEDEDEDEGKIMTDAEWDARFARLDNCIAELRAFSQDNKREIRQIKKANQERDKEVQNLSGAFESIC